MPRSVERVVIKVMFKKEDAARPENNSPICTLSTLYRVFSTLPYAGLITKSTDTNLLTREGFDATFKL